MTENFKIYPSRSAYDGTPPIEYDAGAYYYKYSYYYTSKAASTEIDLTDTVLKFDTSGNKKNNAYIFLSCIGTTSTPPEFGIYAPYGQNGVWKCYTKPSGSDKPEPHETIFSPSGSVNGVYTYKRSTKITMRIRVLGNNIIGTILRNGTVVCSYEVSGKGASIGENSSKNTFLLGVSFVPDPQTTSPGDRNAYLEHVYVRNGLLYAANNYNGTGQAWIPDAGNPVTYYAIVYNTPYITYNRFGTTDEEISINYN